MGEKSRFPMEFTKCPNCGSEETVTKVAGDEEAEKGRLKKDTTVAALQMQNPLMDPKKTPLLIGGKTGILLIQADYCAECGTLYCKNAQLVEGMLGQGPPPGHPGGMGYPPPPFSPS